MRGEAHFAILLRMKSYLFLLCAFLTSSLFAATLDGVAAKVNDGVITIGEVMTELQRNPGARTRLATGGENELQNLFREALNNLIDRRLILRAAADKKMDMQEWVVDNRVREIVKENFDGDMNKLKTALTASKTALNDWRNTIRDDMIIQAMRYQMVEQHLQATPGAMRKEYETNRARYATKASTTVSVILLKPGKPGDKTTPSVTTRGEELLARLEKGEDFATLARLHSADSHAKEGGVWKDIDPAKEFRPEIVETLAKLKPGEFSRLVNLDGWGFIVRKDSEKIMRPLSFHEAYDQIASAVRANEAKKAYDDWMKRLRKEAFIKIYPLPDEKK